MSLLLAFIDLNFFSTDENHYVKSSPPSAAYMSVNRTSIGSEDGLSPIKRQAIIWNNAGISLIGPMETNFNETKFIHLFKKIHLKMLSGKWYPHLHLTASGHEYNSWTSWISWSAEKNIVIKARALLMTVLWLSTSQAFPWKMLSVLFFSTSLTMILLIQVKTWCHAVANYFLDQRSLG